MVKKTLWAYLAGLIDGEGNIDVCLRDNPVHRKTKRGYAREFCMNVGNGSKELLLYLQENIGLGKIYQHKTSTYHNQTKIDMFTLRFFHNDLRIILPNVIPYLRLKKKAAEIMLEMLSLIKTTKTSKIREKQLLEMGMKFREERVNTIGSKCKAKRADDKIREKAISQLNINRKDKEVRENGRNI